MTTTPVQNDLLLSAAAYARWVDPGDDPTELVRGRVVREPRPSVRHGAVQAELASLLISHVRESDAGTVLTESGVILFRDPDTVRGPDVAFYARDRLPDPLPDGFAETAPDLVAEILSPHDTATGLQARIRDYLGAGVRLIWVLDPQGGTVTVYRSPNDIRLLSGDEILEGEEVLPGFRVGVGELLRRS